MIGRLRALFSGGPLYVRLRRDRLSVRDVSSGREFEDEPLLAIGREAPRQIHAVGGRDARLAIGTQPGLELVNGFDHPRLLIADFSCAERVLQYAFAHVLGRGLFQPAPLVVMHPLEKLEGGLTPVEKRAFRELALGAGARKAAIITGPELDDEGVRAVFLSP